MWILHSLFHDCLDFYLLSFYQVIFVKTATMDALQRRVILEDMVQYKLFLVQSNSQQTEEHLPQLVDEILAKVAPFLVQYIWQHQPFNLKYHPEKGIIFRGELILKIGTCFFLGHVRTDGCCVHWQEMSLLTLEVRLSLGTMWRTSGLLFTSCSRSQRHSHNSLPGETACFEFMPNMDQFHLFVNCLQLLYYVCVWRVEDNDGEFLLIEAADYLPKWLNPDTSENRVKIKTIFYSENLVYSVMEKIHFSEFEFLPDNYIAPP